MGRREDDDLILDLRTVDPGEEDALLQAVKALISSETQEGERGGG